MPLKVHITLGSETFEAEGDFEFNTELTSIFRVWVAALGGDEGVSLEEVTEQLERNTQQLETAVAASQPSVTP